MPIFCKAQDKETKGFEREREESGEKQRLLADNPD
jgi:hypothetical protein